MFPTLVMEDSRFRGHLSTVWWIMERDPSLSLLSKNMSSTPSLPFWAGWWRIWRLLTWTSLDWPTRLILITLPLDDRSITCTIAWCTGRRSLFCFVYQFDCINLTTLWGPDASHDWLQWPYLLLSGTCICFVVIWSSLRSPPLILRWRKPGLLWSRAEALAVVCRVCQWFAGFVNDV